MKYDPSLHDQNGFRRLYSVCDTKAGSFMPPFPASNDDVAVRSFVDAVRNTNGILHDHYEDFAVFFLGVQDEFSGVIYGAEIPSVVFRGYELVINKPTVSDNRDGSVAVE